MLIKRKYLGRVSYAPTRHTYYLRVSIPRENDLPLSVKATFTDFDWKTFKKGDWVEVERTSPGDARRYKVVRFMREVPQEFHGGTRPINNTFAIGVDSADEFKKDQDGRRSRINYWKGTTSMDTKEGRVRFWVDPRYLQQDRFYKVLFEAFRITDASARTYYRNNDGFWIICTTDQFARFMIHRNQQGIENGFMDLKADLISAEYKDFYTRLADISGVDRQAIKKIILALNFSTTELERQISQGECRKQLEIDVSDR